MCVLCQFRLYFWHAPHSRILAVVGALLFSAAGPASANFLSDVLSDTGLSAGDFDADLYKERNLVERFCSKIKHLRHVATRYEKLATDFLALVKLAALRHGSDIISPRPNLALRILR